MAVFLLLLLLLWWWCLRGDVFSVVCKCSDSFVERCCVKSVVEKGSREILLWRSVVEERCREMFQGVLRRIVAEKRCRVL